jgi:hypothetical protein
MVKCTDAYLNYSNVNILVTWHLWTTNISQTCSFGSPTPAPCDQNLVYAYDDN